MSFLNYVFGPKLYMEYRGVPEAQRRPYEPGSIEKFGDQILSTLSVIWNIGYYSSPLIVTFLYRRGYLMTESIPLLAKLTTSVGLIVVISLVLRGFGRFQSRVYVNMIKALEQAKTNKTLQAKTDLRRFDIDFQFWPIDFDVKDLQEEHRQNASSLSKRANSHQLATLPCDLAAYLAIHSFGLPMIYPGSLGLVQKFMQPMLISGRSKLIEDDNGIRYKIKTIDLNEIDTVFVDNRRRNSGNGKTLCICSEGNAGFYEIGIMATPIALKYSVLGWNHPGFAGSSGKPYPDQDSNAIDAVVKFAIYHLGFDVEDILLYGWSIGGYSTLSAAINYPDVKGVILDATFDDLLYLAQQRMPNSLSGVVKIAVRNYCNLNNAELILKYSGPVSLIRRTEDEIIADDNNIETNRGNHLVLTLLKYRYPNIFQSTQLTRIKNMLSKPLEVSPLTPAEENLCLSRLVTFASDQGKSFPMQIGEDYSDQIKNQMAVFLLRKHFRDYNSTHCTQLPGDYFNIPWDIPIEHGFVFT